MIRRAAAVAVLCVSVFGVGACNDNGLTVGPARLDVSPAELDFGRVQTTGQSDPLIVTIRNKGGHDLYVTGLRIEPEGIGYSFDVEPPNEDQPWRLQNGTYKPIEVTFAPSVYGDLTGSLVVETRGGSASVGLFGNGFEIREDEFEQGEYGGALADILFVVDNSGSMGDDQAKLGDSFTTFIDWITNSQTDVFYRIAITTTDMSPFGQKGKFVGNPTVLKHSTPDLINKFKANVNVGDNGSGSERGLDASQAAFSEPTLSNWNTGFLRDPAKLYVIYVSDEEDDGTAPISQYVDFFKNLKGDQSLLSFMAIAGEPPNGCSNTYGAGQAAQRYMDMITTTGGTFDTICQPDFGTTLQGLAFDVTQNAPVGFQLSAVPVDGTLEVYVDDVLQPESHYIYDDVGYTISFVDPYQPPAEAHIVFKYEVAGPI